VARESAYDPAFYPHLKRLSDAEVKKQIEQQMAGNSMIEPNQVNVNVKHGVATLTGKVTTEVERDALVHAAYVGGAKDVRDNIKVVVPPPETTTLAPTGR
jgi:osmotically-inducible protein OsmY